jgi:Type II secretion system (T2SS), protein G
VRAPARWSAADAHVVRPLGEEIVSSSPTEGAIKKRSWPLLLLAAGAFLPGFGIFFAAAALTWGLLSDRPRALLAAILGGIGGALNLVGSVLLLWHMQDDPAYAAASAASARQDLVKLVRALEDHRATFGHYPADLAVFTQLPLSLKFVNVRDLSGGAFGKPRLYQYKRAPDDRTYDVYGAGMDGKGGTEDDVQPTVGGVPGHRPGASFREDEAERRSCARADTVARSWCASR